MTTNRSEILGLLAERQQEIVARFGVKRVAPFGSAARGELDPTSASMRWWNTKVRRHFLPTWTSSSTSTICSAEPVDLVTDKSLRKELRPYVEK